MDDMYLSGDWTWYREYGGMDILEIQGCLLEHKKYVRIGEYVPGKGTRIYPISLEDFPLDTQQDELDISC